ncbi:cardiac-enriched FHL2-interacting protein [Eucyclogobius newberryi]|uniref:cardiac-enriched FHL2-interacting protein n=1 Tax=Eucyclogobius newberryi TaxID=166745 RepID=UPI003B5B17D9
MTTVEKRRSGRKSGHRKHNDGGYSDTETDREVSSLTDRAFRSLCIGDEAVYNDSDLCASPCAQDTDRQEMKRAAHESFSLRVQQDWMYRGTYGAEIHKDQQWGVYGERGAQERLSSSFQPSSVEAPQQEHPPSEFSNGTTEVSSQQHRSHSRVSSLIRAFNSEGQGDETMYNDETSWHKSALMSIERELSEFSSYPQNMTTGYFPSAGVFSQNTNYYSSEVAAISQMNSASSFMTSSHSMSTQVNSNFFIHSEFSPFKVWRDQNRFPFHRGQLSGFMPHSEFQKWYETPMYKELSLQAQQHPSMFSQGYHTNTFAPPIPINPQRSTSASTMMPRASAVEKRCESELAGQYRKCSQSLGANRLPSQRPSTASPSSEMSRCVRDTISSVKSLQQKIKMMAERNIETQSQDGYYNNDYLNSYDPMVLNMMNSNPYTAPYQMQKSPVYPPPEPQQLLQHYPVSPQPVAHAPVRAESRGSTPDVKMSSYKSRAASLLYNLKDNRKRVKATYNPATFKGQDTQEKYKQEPKDFIIDVPECSANEPLNSIDDRTYRSDVPEYAYQALSPGMHTNNSQPTFENPIDMSKLNVPQYGYQSYSLGMQQNSQYGHNSQPELENPVENSANTLNVPQYGYQARSPGMQQNSQHMQNSQHKLVSPREERGTKLNVAQYGYQTHSPGMQQNIQFPQYFQNMQNSQQLYPNQNSSEYYRAAMQGEVAPHHGFTGYTPEYYANTQLANGQNPYGNTSSFTPYKQSMSDKGGNYVNQLEQNTEVQRFGAVVQSRDFVSKDNSKQQFNEAASGEYTGVDRYNQLKENKYDYNNVYSQDVWRQTNSQQIQKPGIPSAQNYQNINAYPRTNTQENVLNYKYEQKLMENYSARPHGTSNISNQMLQYAPPHLANTGNAGYNTQQQPGTYRDIYAPPTPHEVNKEIKMKENNAPQDNHKYYDQESKKQTAISSQAEMPIATDELGQRKDEAIKEIRIKGTNHFEQSEQEKKQEQVKDISIRDQASNGQVFLQQNKTNVHKTEMNEMKERCFKPQQYKVGVEKDVFAKYRCVQDKDLPTAEEMIKQLRGENSNCDHVEVQDVIDEQECIMEGEPQRPEPEELQLVVEHANSKELKEESIKCELAASSEEARIEQVKPEPSREQQRVIAEQATEKQVGVEHVERTIEEAKQAQTELIMESPGNTKPDPNKGIENVAVEGTNPAIAEQKSQEEKEEEVTAIKVTEHTISEEMAKTLQIPKEDATDKAESLSKSESKQSVTCEPDNVELAKTELAKTKAELVKIKEKMKGEQKGQIDGEHIEQRNDNGNLLFKEPPVTMSSVDFADRGANDCEHIGEKQGSSQATARNKTSTIDNVNELSMTPDKKDELIENKLDTNEDNCIISDVISDTTEGNEKVNADPTESQYFYSESSKDFKLSDCNITAHEDTKDVSEHFSTKEDAPVEKVDKSNKSQQRDDAKQPHVDECKTSLSNLTDHTNNETVLKNNACMLNNVSVEKVDKYDISQQKDVAKQVPKERRAKSTDQKLGTNKETSIKGLTHKEKAQTKQEILTSKIKAHAEKEISAIKEGFAIKDGLKNPTKPLGQNINIRQKPPSQEEYKKQERPMSGDTSKVLQPPAAVTASGRPAEQPQKHIKNNEKAKEKVATETNKELNTTKTFSSTITENLTIQKDQKFTSPTDDKSVKPHEDKPLEDHLSKGDNVDRTDLNNTTPSLQFHNESSAQSNSLNIVGIMVTVRERNPLECEREDNKDQDILCVRSHDRDKHGSHVEANNTRLSNKVCVAQAKYANDYDETMHITNVSDSMTTLESAQNNLSDSTTKKTLQQENSPTNDRPQSETLLPEHLAEKVVPATLTVPAKNQVSVETRPLPNKQDIIAEETKVYANKPTNAALETTCIKGQEDIAGTKTKHTVPSKTEMNKVKSVSTMGNEKTQDDNLHIDNIAIRIVTAGIEEVNKTQQSNSSVTEKETQNNTQFSSQKSVPSNDDVQNVLSSVRKQAQLLKHTNQPNLINTSSESTDNKKRDETNKSPIEEGYFQVDKRDTGPQNSSNVGNAEAVSKEREYPRSLQNKSSSASTQDQNIKTSKQTDNAPKDKSNKDVKLEASHSHHTRRHPMAKGRQRGLSSLQDSTDGTVEVKPKPKVPIPEISALADYARLKVIVSKDDEDTLQEQPPNKKEGFFPLIQSRHSRRPVFTMDSQEDHVEEKSSQNQSDAKIKVSKEPTPVVFPITEKQHQRTGMFKLGAKENNNSEVQNIQKSKIEQSPRDKTNNGEKNTVDRIKNMLDKSREKQAEEDKRAAQREEEQRARERETIAAQIRERRKKQREAENPNPMHPEEEGKGKVVEQQIHPEDKEQAGTAEENDALSKTTVQKDERKSPVLVEHKDKQPRSAVLEESHKAEEEKKKYILKEQQRRAAQIEEQKKRLSLEEQQKRAALEEQQNNVTQSEERKRKIAEEEQLKKAVQEEQIRRANEEQQRATLEEKQRKTVQIEEQKRRLCLEEQQKRVVDKEQQRNMAEEEQQRQATVIEEQNKRAAMEEQNRNMTHAAQKEQKQKTGQEEEQRRAAQKEKQRKIAEEEHQRQAAIIKEKKKRAALEEQQRRMAHEEQQKQAAQKEQQRKMAEEEQERQAAIIVEQKKRAALEEQQRQVALEEQEQKAALEEQQRRATQKEQERKMAEEEQQRQAAIIKEQKKRAALEEQQRKMAHEEQQRQVALEEQKQKVAHEEQQRQAALKEQQRKTAEEEQQRQAARINTQKKSSALEEQQKIAQKEQQRQTAQEEQKQKAALEEQRRRASQKEQLQNMAEEEQQSKAALIKEQKRKAAVEELQRKAVLMEEQRRAALEEQLRKNKMAEEEHQRKEALALFEETRRKTAHTEHLRKSVVIEEQKRSAALQEEQQTKAKLEEQKRKAAIEEQKQIAQIEEMRKQAADEEQLRTMVKEEQQHKAAAIEEARSAVEEQQRRTAREEKMRKSAETEEQKRRAAVEEEQQRPEERKKNAAKEEQRRKDSQIEKQRHTRQEEEEKRLAYIREERIKRQIEEEREAQIEEERTRQQQSSEENQTHKGKDKQLFRSQNQKDVRARPAVYQEGTAEIEEQKIKCEKTETLQYYSLTTAEAEKPSPPQRRSNSNGPETVEDTGRPHALVSPAPSLPRSSASSPAFGTKPSMFKVKDNTIRGSSLTKSIKPRFHKSFGEEFRVGSPMEGDQNALRCRTPSTPLPQYRPFSRRSLVLDEDDSRSIISNMSEDMESFATGATDLADIRTLYDSDRPESACSFSSDVSRSFGKPPAVLPKSEKALRRAKRLATRRLKKDLSKDMTKDSYEASMTEVANSDVVASPHFTPPISIARAPPPGSNLSSSHSKHSQHRTIHGTGPSSVANTSPHSSIPVPVPSSQNPGLFHTSASPRSIPQVPSSPTHHRAPKPVTQYQVESGFPQAYTQRRVMQDVGSGQYYVVDVPVEVKTKTFFDPETGKYVQLNVRESGRNTTQRKPLQGYPQPHLKPKIHPQPQSNLPSNAQYQDYSSNSKGYHSAPNSSGPVIQSMTPGTVTQDQQPRSSRTHQHEGPETGFSYSPDKTPYMDTVNNVDKVHHAVYNTQGSQGAISEGDNQLVNTRYGKRDIITMGELEDFMEVSDW